jgi:uncharacterized surface anchored protein
VTETNTPDRYVQPDSQTVSLTSDQTISFSNILKKAYVKFVKKCSFYDGYLTGATYGIYKADGTYTGYDITSDASYWVYSPLLSYGDYYLQEKSAPTYYALDTTKYPFSITENGENVAVTTYDPPLADVYPELVQPNATYTAGTDIIVSYHIYNDSLAQWTPDNPLSVTFTATADGQTISSQTASALVPSFSDNLLYFTVSLPESCTAVDFRCTVASPDSVAETDTANNTTSDTLSFTPAMYSQTPDTEFESTPDSFLRPSDTAVVPTAGYTPVSAATWQMWDYENDAFVLKTYGMTLETEQVLTPDVNAFSSYYENERWHMRSGYGYSLTATSGITALADTLFPGSDMVILPQSGHAYLPEFAFSDDIGEYRTLELTAADTMEFKPNPYTITDTGESDYRRISFTPLWYPDGKYVVKTFLYNAWTPAGMLSTATTLDPIIIEGDMYDDWVIVHTD